MEVEAQESNSQNDAIVSSSCEIIFALKQEALFFVESHNWNPDAAVSTFQDNKPPSSPLLPSSGSNAA
ncbi:hypothetical protein ACFX12_028796 [Malus domestica]